MPEGKYQTILDALALASSPIPIAGDLAGAAADGYRYWNQPGERTPGNFALSAAGLLPLIPAVGSIKSAGKLAEKSLDTYRVGKPGLFYGTDIKNGIKQTLPLEGEGVKLFDVSGHLGQGHGAPLADALASGKIPIPELLARKLKKLSPGDETWDTDLLAALIEHGRGTKVMHFREPTNPAQIVSVDLRGFNRERALQELSTNLQPLKKGEFSFASDNWKHSIDSADNKAVLDIIKRLSSGN